MNAYVRRNDERNYASIGDSDTGQRQPTYQKKRLVVLLHAWNQRPEQLRDIQQLVSQKLPDADFFVPQLPLGLFSCKRLDVLSNMIATQLDFHWSERCNVDKNGYEEIFLVGHSAGATLVRTVYLCGLGTDFTSDELRSGKLRPWANRVKRIILFAAFNRGWEVSYLAQGFRAFGFELARQVAFVLRALVGSHVGLQLYRGSRFINEMRLRWQWFEQHHQELGLAWPLVMQLLGSRDDIIAPDDAVDLATGQRFVYLEVPFTNHSNIVQLYESSGNGENGEILANRRRVFEWALCKDEAELRQRSELEFPTKPDLSVDHVVFVVHGIRDAGFWAQHIARTVLHRAELAGLKGKVKALYPSYGYFGMGPFLFQRNRRNKVAWFMEHYFLARAHFPKARISYIGHSNGTYLPTCALELYPSCRFERLGFAGSVVRSRFPWDNFFQESNRKINAMPRVEKVCNFVATDDLVVAGFPSLFEFLPLTDLGGAGHRGFEQTCQGRVINFRFAPGGHAAALAEPFWEPLGDFIVTGNLPNGAQRLAESHQHSLARIIGSFPLLAWCLAVLGAALLFAGFLSVAHALSSFTPAHRDYWIGGSIVAGIWALRTLLRKI